jgi:hypothetical protein
MKEMVNHPGHYGGEGNPYEVINIIEHYNLDFAAGNALKYLLRYKKKNGIEDLKKCEWYIKWLIMKEEKYKELLNVSQCNQK